MRIFFTLLVVMVIGISGCGGSGGDDATVIASSVPVVTNVSASGNSGDITVTYDLIDADSDTITLNFDYSADGGSNWNTASTSSPLTGQVPGTEKTLLWQSALNEDGESGTNYMVRITPNDGAVGTAGQSSAFTINYPSFESCSPNITGGASSGSLAWGDYDNDGDLDIVIYLNIGILEYKTFIYRNDSGSFVDSGIELPTVASCSFAWGDYDNDGDLDLALAGEPLTGSYGIITKIYRNDNGVFVESGIVLAGVKSGDLAWGDYDNDGDLDLALAGDPGSSLPLVTKIYRNDNGDFAESGIVLPGVTYCSLDWGDFDNDGDLDLALAGEYNDDEYFTRIYKNSNSTFADSGIALPGIYDCELAWGDYDNDGDLDLALAGYSNPIYGYSPIARIYENSNGTLVDTQIELRGAGRSALAWGDFDNDADLDLIVSGFDSEYVFDTIIYRNDLGTFVDSGIELGSNAGGAIAWGDYDSDGDLDCAMSGSSYDDDRPAIFENLSVVSNSIPQQPVNLRSSVTGSGPVYDVTFTWDHGVDAETPLAGLTYELRVGTKFGSQDIYSAMHLDDGQRLLPLPGSIKVNSHTLKLPAGTYYWTATTIDSALEGSSILLGWAMTSVP